MVNNSRGIDLSVCVPMQKLTEGQVREFRELTRTIDFLEGRMGTEEVDKSTLPKLELLEGYKEKDPECDLDYVPNKGIEGNIDCAASGSLGFGGHNGVVVFKKIK